MKDLTIGIFESLQNDQIHRYLDEYKIHGYTLGDFSILDITENYKFASAILVAAIQNGTFDQLSYGRRRTIVDTYNGALNSYASILQFMQNVDTLCESILTSGIIPLQINKKDYDSELRKMISYQTKINALQSSFQEKSLELESIAHLQEEATKDIASIAGYLQEINVYSETLEKTKLQIDNDRTDSNNILSSLKTTEKDVESKRLVIETFATNIDEYKKTISEYSDSAATIISKEVKINDLIASAEAALGIKSAEGISAAFTAQYTAAIKGKSGWLFGAGSFLIASCLATVWVLTGWGIDKPNEIAAILGRIVSVGIMIAGATFCATQYQRQLSIGEDYAYKAVLAKSILAFSDAIKQRNDAQVTEYLTKVLSEIHKDPQRTRSTKNNVSEKINLNSLFDKILDKIPGGK